MKVYMIETVPHPWELGGGYLLKATIDLNAARKYCENYIRENARSNIDEAIDEWQREFETFVPMGANAESDLIVCRVISVDEH